MKQHFTVYFDTCFYVWLRKADETTANQTINALNTLNIRHVISNVLLRELLAFGNRPDFDKLLVGRLRQFRISPYQTQDDLLWDALLYSGQDRIDYANFLQQLHDELTKAESLSITAQRDSTEEETAKFLEANRDALKEFGFSADFQPNMPQLMSRLKGMFDALGVQGLDWPENPTPEELHKLPEQILERGRDTYGHSLFDQVEEGRLVRNSSTETEDRPFQVASEAASDKTRQRLGNTLRDAEHITLFIHNRSEIDFLQVDSKHEKILRRKTPIHRIAELGLLERCFSAASLLGVVEKVRELIQKEESSNQQQSISPLTGANRDG
ncbi:MAG TPA: hypothetical protein VN256_07280 [Pyrinomonadaceae bacterium]|nr:hypothetical protein [Pyrinomonadaceae bacterium]